MIFGNKGEKQIQSQHESLDRADRFYKNQMQNHLNEKMLNLIERQDMVFIATSDSNGNCDCSPRFGKPGFVVPPNKYTLAYPEYKGNGVFASLGNIIENPHIGMVFIDFFNTTVGLHVNGRANSYLLNELPKKFLTTINNLSKNIDTHIERWVIIEIDEAYIHCSKHVPKLEKKNKKIIWGTDNKKEKSVNFFKK